VVCEGAPQCGESGFVLINVVDLDLVIARESIHEGKDLMPLFLWKGEEDFASVE
jgi:hypothetical protein